MQIIDTLSLEERKKKKRKKLVVRSLLTTRDRTTKCGLNIKSKTF